MIGNPSDAGNNKEHAKLHQKGHLALHVTRRPVGTFFDKIEDRRIINNLREDGGTDLKIQGHQFYTIISATVLPQAQFNIQQNLYDFAGRVFVGIDMENSIAKGFSPADAQATYHATNSKGRPTYRATLMHKDILLDPVQERLPFIDKLNYRTAQKVTLPSKTRLFGERKPEFRRGMNEVLLKVTNKSMLFIGTTAENLAKNPDVLLDLIYMQKQLKANSGVDYPIYIYNNKPSGIELDLLESTPQTIPENQFYEVNIESALKQIIQKYPETIETTLEATFSNDAEKYPIKDYLNLIGYQVVGNELRNQENPDADKIKGMQYAQTVENVLNEFKTQLMPYSEQDGVVQIHHPDRAVDEQYPDINQKQLAQFIKDKVMGLGDSNEIPPNQMETFNAYMKTYNTQFRLEVYKELLNNGLPMNYPNLEKDLQWSKALLLKIAGKPESTQDQDAPKSARVPAIATSFQTMSQGARSSQSAPEISPEPENKKSSIFKNN